MKWAETVLIDAGYKHEGRLMAATKLMLAAVSTFFGQWHLKNANCKKIKIKNDVKKKKAKHCVFL